MSRRTRTWKLVGAISMVLAWSFGCSVQDKAAPESSQASSPALPEGVLASVSVEDSPYPAGLVAAAGSLWVVGQKSVVVSRIDPVTDTVAQTINVGQETCSIPSEAVGHLLVGPCAGDSTAVIDLAAGKVIATIPDAAGGAVVAAGSVWVSNYDGTALNRVNPTTWTVEQKLRVASGLVAFDGDSVWVASCDLNGYADGSLTKIDPSTARVVSRHRVEAMQGPFMTVGFDALWFKPLDSPRLQRFDLEKSRATSVDLEGWQELTGFGDQPVAVGADSLWVRRSDGEIARIDPVDSHVLGTYPADPYGHGGHPLVAFDSLWVTNFDTNSVWRVQI